MNDMIFFNFFTFFKISFLKKIKAIIEPLLVQLPGKLLCVICKIRNVTLIFQNF